MITQKDLDIITLRTVLKSAVAALEDYIPRLEKAEGASLNWGKSIVRDAKTLGIPTSDG